MTAIESISADAVAAEYYTLQGIRVAADRLKPGLYIERRGGRASKVRIR